MPLTRVLVEYPIGFGDGTYIYPAGIAKIGALNVRSFVLGSSGLAEFQSAASGVDLTTLNNHVLIGFACGSFDWESLKSGDHKDHMELLRYFSEVADRKCLDIVRYHQCRLDLPDTLPGRPGQTENNMMAGALIFNAGLCEGRIIGGDAFFTMVTKGLGLDISPVSIDNMPANGTVGHTARHALSLYSRLLEIDNQSVKFAQAIALLEFLASPFEYQQFKKSKKVIARYVANDRSEYDRLLVRFQELTGNVDSSGQQAGYRTRIVHMGDRIERLIPSMLDRQKLFKELDRYIHKVLDHLIEYSHWGWEDYEKVREQLKPFEQ
ncbi:MAG TPA: hypothetical protein VFK06_08680 [Candidatus Angelobacter sp.]|nr:hypothetical protein [Candidatus Angelobacter sp.]